MVPLIFPTKRVQSFRSRGQRERGSHGAKGEVQSLGCSSQRVKEDSRFWFCLLFAYLLNVLLALFTVGMRLLHGDAVLAGLDKEAG